MAVAAPVIELEMADWVRLGGRNSGIVGDSGHRSGYHRGADEVPSTDYSRRRDPNGSDGPFTNWKYACAGDFWHGGSEALRAKHREVLNGLMGGKFPMICEFIGKPWADRPVYYWARWNGIKTLQRYTGSGHDTWSHIAWWRSRAGERAHLWTPSSGGSLIMFTRKGEKGQVVQFLQYRLRALGFDVGAIDSDYGPKVSAALKAACKKQYANYGGTGESYGPAEMIYVDALWAAKYGGGGQKGDKGDPGEPGKDGKDGRDGMLLLPEKVTIEAIVKPAG